MQRHSFCRALQLWQVLFLSFSIVFPYFLWVSLDVEGAGGKEGRELAGLPSPRDSLLMAVEGGRKSVPDRLLLPNHCSTTMASYAFWCSKRCLLEPFGSTFNASGLQYFGTNSGRLNPFR